MFMRAHRSRTLILLACLFTISGGCGRNPDTSENSRASNSSPPSETVPDDGLIDSLKASSVGSFELTDQNSETFTEVQLRNKLAVITFVFTRCPGTCPRQSAAMQQLQERIAASGVDQIQLITISVDPDYDTPEVLSKYADSFNADPDRWTFLTGDKDDIWKLSRNQLGMSVSENPSDPLIPIAHESKFVLLDRSSKIRGYYDSLTAEGLDQLWSAIDVILPEFEPGTDLSAQYSFPDNVRHMAQPPGILDDQWLSKLASKENSNLATSGALPGFQFTESARDFGITFQPQIVDDQRHRLLVNHYDHGNGVSVADVNGDSFLDLYFTSQVGPNELWHGTADGQFRQATQLAGIGLPDRISVAASFADTDNDGDPDLFVTSIRSSNVFFENTGNGKFVERTSESGLSYTGHSSKGTFFDYDRDGLLDLFVSNVGKFTTEEAAAVRKDLCNTQPETNLTYYVGRPDAFSGHLVPDLAECSRLYRNLGGNRFEDVTEEFDLQSDTSWSGDAIAFDANDDSWPDLYVCNMQGHDHLYINNEGQGFTDQTDAYFHATPWGTMGAAVTDFDNSGTLDLFLTDMHSDMSIDVPPEQEKDKSKIAWPEEFLQSEGRSIYGNAFFRQTETGKYAEISDEINAENYWPWGLSHADINADGFQDAFVTSSMCFPYRYCTNSLLLNDNGNRFLDAHFSTGIEPRKKTDQIAPWFTLDFNGDDANTSFQKSRTGKWVVWSATGSRSSVIFDIDNDGDLDIVTNEFNTRPQVFRSNLHQRSPRYLKIALRGTRSNRDAFGAKVTVQTDAQTQTQLNSGATGYLSQSSAPLYFGLATAQSILQITVQWPTGIQQTLEGPIETNQSLLIVEDVKAE